jgi:hypothetical protein
VTNIRLIDIMTEQEIKRGIRILKVVEKTIKYGVTKNK